VKRKKLFITLSIIIPIVVVITVVFVIPIAEGGTRPYTGYKIFTNIEEFNFVESIGAEVLTPDVDKDIKDINFIESLEYKIKYDGATYNIYAYVFDNNANAKSYFKNVTSISHEIDIAFSGTGNYYFSTRRVVMYNNKAYKIKGQGEKKFTEFLKVMENYLTGPKILESM